MCVTGVTGGRWYRNGETDILCLWQGSVVDVSSGMVRQTLYVCDWGHGWMLVQEW